jgi:hypothetical protein
MKRPASLALRAIVLAATAVALLCAAFGAIVLALSEPTYPSGVESHAEEARYFLFFGVCVAVLSYGIFTLIKRP